MCHNTTMLNLHIYIFFKATKLTLPLFVHPSNPKYSFRHNTYRYLSMITTTFYVVLQRNNWNVGILCAVFSGLQAFQTLRVLYCMPSVFMTDEGNYYLSIIFRRVHL